MLDVPNEDDDLEGNGAGQNNGNVPDREPKRSKINSVSDNKRVQMIHHLRMLGMCLQVLLFLVV
jgi:hypothetical protein